MEAYDVDHGICEHSSNDNPLSLVSMHSGEDWYSYGRLEMLMERFRLRHVHEHFGCSFFDLIQNPRYVVESILYYAKKAEEEKGKKTNQALNALQAEQQALKNQ